MESSIEFDANFEHLNIDIFDIAKILPAWKTRVLEVSVDNSLLKLKLLLAASTVEEIKKWQKAYEELNFCSYSVKSTEKCSGRYLLFKQRLYCQRNTQCSRIRKSYKHIRTRNTNCPSSIQFTLQAIKRVYRGKIKSKAPDRSMPCVVRLVATHNHTTNSPDALRFRQVSDSVKEKLIKLYESGHTVGTALEAIKAEIRQNCEDYESKLFDRKYCPDYSYCYHLYTSEFKKRYSPNNLNKDAKDFLMQHVQQYNQETNENSVQVAFPDDSSYVICICPPLCRRIHEMMKSASEEVIIDSSGALDREVGRIFILFTNSDCGGLPLGVIIISSRDAALLSLGFDLLKNMLGEILFGGNVNGPNVFLINDSSVEQAAVKSSWTNSHCLLHIFHVLRSVWMWLLSPTNKIEEEDRYRLFQDFKSMLYGDTLRVCQANYKRAVFNAKAYSSYLEFLEQFWVRKELWALCYRRNLLADFKGDDWSEAATWLFKEKIFDRTKSHSLIQTVDFISTKFSQHYEKRVLDAAFNNLKSSFCVADFKKPPQMVLDHIQSLSDRIYLVPCEKQPNLQYIVNAEVLICSCTRGSSQICKHIYWICSVDDHPDHLIEINDSGVRQQFYRIATGKEPPLDWLQMPHPTRLSKPKKTSCRMQEIYIKEEEIPYISDEVVPEPEFSDGEELEEGRETIENIFLRFKQMLEKDPHAVAQSLKIMEQNTAKLETASAFTSACENFGLETRRTDSCEESAPVQQLLLVNNNLVLGKVFEVGDHSKRYLINYKTNGT